MSIFITGDTHGDFRRFSNQHFSEGKNLNRNDYVIICGDFGGIWDTDEHNLSEKYWLDWLNAKPWTTLFIDGNHENFTRLNSFPQVEFCGGLTHQIRPHIYHLMRGEIFEIDNCTIFAFGGAPSHDTQDGIIDPSIDKDWKDTAKLWRKQHKLFRIKGISWWKEEVPTAADFDNAKKNLALHNNKVDFIVTHEAPAATFYEMALWGKVLPSQYEPSETSKQIQDLISNVEYKQHYFGHHHLDKRFNFSECLYTTIQQIY